MWKTTVLDVLSSKQPMGYLVNTLTSDPYARVVYCELMCQMVRFLRAYDFRT